MERNITDDEVNEALEQVKPYLKSMSSFGQLQIHFKRHADNFGKTDVVKVTQRRYSDTEPNVSCTTDIFNMIKGVSAAGLDGALTFSVTFKKGKADLLQVQDFRKL